MPKRRRSGALRQVSAESLPWRKPTWDRNGRSVGPRRPISVNLAAPSSSRQQQSSSHHKAGKDTMPSQRSQGEAAVSAGALAGTPRGSAKVGPGSSAEGRAGVLSSSSMRGSAQQQAAATQSGLVPCSLTSLPPLAAAAAAAPGPGSNSSGSPVASTAPAAAAADEKAATADAEEPAEAPAATPPPPAAAEAAASGGASVEPPAPAPLQDPLALPLSSIDPARLPPEARALWQGAWDRSGPDLPLLDLAGPSCPREARLVSGCGRSDPLSGPAPALALAGGYTRDRSNC